MSAPPPPDVAEYLAAFPPAIAARMIQVRQTIVAAVPNPSEKMRYGIAAVMLDGTNALHYAGWKNHIGVYPVPTLPGSLEWEIAPYRTTKDAVGFPHNAELPYSLLSRMTAAIVAQRKKS